MTQGAFLVLFSCLLFLFFSSPPPTVCALLPGANSCFSPSPSQYRFLQGNTKEERHRKGRKKEKQRLLAYFVFPFPGVLITRIQPGTTTRTTWPSGWSIEIGTWAWFGGDGGRVHDKPKTGRLLSLSHMWICDEAGNFFGRVGHWKLCHTIPYHTQLERVGRKRPGNMSSALARVQSGMTHTLKMTTMDRSASCENVLWSSLSAGRSHLHCPPAGLQLIEEEEGPMYIFRPYVRESSSGWLAGRGPWLCHACHWLASRPHEKQLPSKTYYVQIGTEAQGAVIERGERPGICGSTPTATAILLADLT